MKYLLRIFETIFIVMIMTVSLNGCGDGGTQNEQKVIQEPVANAFDSWFPFNTPLFGQQEAEGFQIQNPDKAIQAKEVYDNITYIPEMFWGKYRMDHEKDGYAENEPTQVFLDTCEWTDAASYIGPTNKYESCSTLPYMMKAGSKEIEDRLVFVPDHDWCSLYFATKHAGVDTSYSYIEKDAAYQIVGNKISFMILDKWVYDHQSDSVEYTFSPFVLTYEFSFRGPQLTLSTETAGVDLMAEYFLNDTEQNFIMTGVCLQDSEPIDQIESITISAAGKPLFMVADDANQDGVAGTKYGSTGAILGDDGLLTFNYTDENGEDHHHQFVMFCCGKNGMILTDGITNHFYMSEFMQFEFSFYSNMEGINNISKKDKEKFKGLTGEEVQVIMETRSDLLSDLTKAFSDRGIEATIDPDTGEITLASQILFDTAQSQVSEYGMQVLNNFINAFSQVTALNEYDGFIKSVAVQGHTDTAGDYDSNQKLSEERANNVLACCLEALDNPGDRERIEKLFYTEGCSYNYPIYKEDGTVDMDASRRVVFVFYIDLDYAK